MMESSLMRVNDAALLLKLAASGRSIDGLQKAVCMPPRSVEAACGCFRNRWTGLIERARVDHPKAQDGSRTITTHVRAMGQKRKK